MGDDRRRGAKVTGNEGRCKAYFWLYGAALGLRRNRPRRVAARLSYAGLP